MEYKKYTLKELLSGEFFDEFVEVKGIPRGSTANNNNNIWTYLQSGGQFIQCSGKHMYHGMPGPTLALLRASSESGIEMTIRGKYSSKTIDGHPADLILHRVDLNNVGIDFLPED